MTSLRATSADTVSPAANLRCRNCGATVDLTPVHACFECFGPLEVGYDHDILKAVTREQIEAGPHNIWRYAPLLPVGQDPASRVSLNPGMTPLIKADNLARELGMKALWVKDDSANPTHSFKDRVVSMAATAAKSLGFKRIAAASTGNLANSVAAHAARTGLKSVVFIPSDLELSKVVQSAVYAGTLVAVDGSYDDVNRLTSELAETDEFEDVAFVNQNVRPYYAEGSKTLGFEVAEQLGWRLPRQVVVPIASGSQFTKIDKAFGELVEIGLVPDSPWTMFATWSSRSSRPASPSRSISATRPTVRTRWTPRAGPAVRSRTSATTRSATVSSCWPVRPGSSPRPPAA
jgi:threonine synthase